MTTGYLSLCHVMIFEFQLRKLVLLNSIELNFQLEFQTLKFFKKFSVLRKITLKFETISLQVYIDIQN